VLAAGCDDGTVRVWRLPDGTKLLDASAGQRPLALWYPEPDRLYVAGIEGLVVIGPPAS
jgi:hypothetical protein